MSGAAWCAEGMEKKIIDKAAIRQRLDRGNVPSRQGRLELFSRPLKTVYADWIDPLVQWFQIFAGGYRARKALLIDGHKGVQRCASGLEQRIIKKRST
jgi:hypothetical protein